MNATPTRPGADERAELARLLPPPAERDLPSDRHRQLQEFLMDHIQRNPRSAAERPRRWPRRRLAYVTAGLAAAVAVAAVAVGGLGDARPPVIAEGDRATASAPGSLPAQQMLLAAASTAERAPEGSGAYWYVKVVSSDAGNGDSSVIETWTARDGQTWMRASFADPAAASPGTSPGKGDGKVIEFPAPNPFRLGGAEVTLEQLRALPTEPDPLRTRIDTLIKDSGVRTSAGELTAAQRERAVFEALVSLVCQLPAPPDVRAAAFRAFASYPNVESRGAVDGGQDLLISFFEGEPAQLVIDPATAQVRRANVVVMADGGIMTAAEGSTFTLTTGWTDTLPR